ncbi:hypothetical protein [Silvanigrella sp.]|jgi:hypothetical protein|uniref:hypothetical protein n=1 Tax=Silvanigrella sp. TaxID=2024976 RepID=UPI0037C5F78D
MSLPTIKKIFLLSCLVFSSAYADININDNIYQNCILDNNGIMYGCTAREEPILGTLEFSQRKDIKFKYKIDYNYSCNANRLTNINIVSESDNLTLGNFRYLGGTIEGEANGRLVIKDLSPMNTRRAKYNAACKLEIIKIEQDLSASSILGLKRDICTMQSLNYSYYQSRIVSDLSQSLRNNIGTLSSDQLNRELSYLKSNLDFMKRQTSSREAKQQIDNIIGSNNNPLVGTINYIMAKSSTWEMGSYQKISNMNILYNNMQNILTSMRDRVENNIKNIYDSNKDISLIKQFPSVPELFDNLMFEYRTLIGEDTSKNIQAECQ